MIFEYVHLVAENIQTDNLGHSADNLLTDESTQNIKNVNLQSAKVHHKI